jgi:hypothetical protein
MDGYMLMMRIITSESLLVEKWFGVSYCLKLENINRSSGENTLNVIPFVIVWKYHFHN